MNKPLIFLGLYAMLVASVSCAISKDDLRSGVNLYSWRMTNAQYAFVFVRKAENQEFLRTFRPEMPHITGITKLNVELAKFPRGSSVTWRDYETIGLIFPAAPIRWKIQKLAEARGIHIEIVPTIYD